MRYLSRGELFGSTVTNVTFVSRLFITIDFHAVAKTRLTRDYWENWTSRFHGGGEVVEKAKNVAPNETVWSSYVFAVHSLHAPGSRFCRFTRRAARRPFRRLP